VSSKAFNILDIFFLFNRYIMNENTRAAAAMFRGDTSSFGRPIVPTTAMAEYASGEYDRALDEYEMEQMVESFIDSISSIPDNDTPMEGGRHKKQQGGGSKLRAACERVKANFKTKAAQIVDTVDGAAAEVIESKFGDVRSAMRSAAVVSAASTVLFGIPNAPFISSALQTLCSNLPSALYNSAANLISASLTAAQITALGVTGIAGLMTFAIMIITLYKINGIAMGSMRSAAINTAGFIQSLVNWNPRGVSVSMVTMDQVRMAIGMVMPRFSPVVNTKYKIGIMIISGPKAADLVRSMTKRAPGADVSDLVMRQQGGKQRNKRKQSKHKQKKETYSNKKKNKRTTMKKH